jgi:hypothetical protein
VNKIALETIKVFANITSFREMLKGICFFIWHVKPLAQFWEGMQHTTTEETYLLNAAVHFLRQCCWVTP